ncbi:Scr1 family TA system antitoxin-like transcriptional regulator [Streptomyces sp. NPDC001339]|uniref:helix-turn-helix domain-containing protein n=1 Tax=Streptomyces sp. NPDC001339 TaxID=3364563 RepID=UPI00368F5089
MAVSSSDHHGSNEPEPSDSLRTFGAVYQGFRENAGFTQESLAPEIRYSRDFIASIEQGRRFPSKQFIDRSEDVLNACGVLHKAARPLTRKRGLATWFRQWAKLEQQALSLLTYECRLIPGLLQTESYARAVFMDQLPPLDDAQIDIQLAARMERQRLLWERPNSLYGFILEEHLFLRRTGGNDITRELIDHVLNIGRLRNVEIQIMPLVRKTHAGLHGPIRLAETPEHEWFGYSEGQESGQFLSDPKVVATLQKRYATMRTQALSLEDSVSLLERMRGEL